MGDRLCSWEHALACEAAAKRRVCPGCLAGTALFPVSVERDGTRAVDTWCIKCKVTVEPVVDPIDYDWLAFLPASCVVPSVPFDADEMLRGPISSEVFDFLLGSCPTRSPQSR